VAVNPTHINTEKRIFLERNSCVIFNGVFLLFEYLSACGVVLEIG
jgi:hypothetical protein